MSVSAVQKEVSRSVDGEDSGAIVDRMVSVKNPYNGLFMNCVVPNSNISECRIPWTEEAKSKPGLFRD